MNLAFKDFLPLAPSFLKKDDMELHLSYDKEADVLYVNLKERAFAEDSELTDDDIVVHYDSKGNVVGMTILHYSKRKSLRSLKQTLGKHKTRLSAGYRIREKRKTL